MSEKDRPEEPKLTPGGRAIRGALNAAGGVVPIVGGLLSAAVSAWSEHEQEKVNHFFKEWLKMLEAEMAEKAQTVIEIMERLDLQDEEISKRLKSAEYQSLLRKGFREWAAAESEQKRVITRNILANAAATTIVSDDIIRLFLEWLKNYSEIHFAVVSAVYNESGITRASIWTKMGKQPVRENSAEADLFKLLIRDLSTGGLVRQHREVDYQGNFIRKQPRRGPATSSRSPVMKSAFDDDESYELTELGSQFVHYAMTELPPKISFDPSQFSPSSSEAEVESAPAS